MRVPKSLGKYDIDEIIGEGAMGTVYRAYDSALGRQVAIKTIHQHLLHADEHGVRERFKREAQSAAKCLHPNIVTIFDFGEQDGSPYIVMEYVDGCELKTYLQAQKQIKAQQAVLYALQILDALKYLHQHKIIHRDIKPANVMLLEDETVKLTDFGIARVDTSALTGTTFLGTPSYMSPEQIQGQTPDHRSDYYAVGVLLYELVSGRKPFSGSDPLSTIHNVMHHIPEDLTVNNRDIPVNFSQVVMKAMEKDPDERFQQAEDFIKAIQNSFEGENKEENETILGVAGTLLGESEVSHIISQQKEENKNANNEWDDETLTTLSGRLLKTLGPIAPVLVRRIAKEVSSLDDLYLQLAEHLPDGQDREQFLKQRYPSRESSQVIEKSYVTAVVEANLESSKLLSDDDLLAVEKELVKFIGPIAKMVVKRASKKIDKREEFHEFLLKSLRTDKEREAFSQKVKHLITPEA